MKNVSLKNKIILTIVLFVLFYVSLAIYSDIDKIKENFGHIKFIYLFPIVGVLTLSMFLRSLLQRFLLNVIEIKLSAKENFLLFLSGLSMLITPGGSGQMIKSHFIEEKHGHPIMKSLPLVFAERFFDFIAIVMIVILTIFLYYSLISLVVIIVSALILVSVFVILKNKKIQNSFKSLLSKISFLQKRIPSDSEFTTTLDKFFESDTIARALPFALTAFLLEGMAIYLCFMSFSIDLGYLQTFQIYYTSVLLGNFSFIPGGVGVLEGSFAKLLVQKHFELPLVTALIIFIRITTSWYGTGLGFIASYFTMSRKKVTHSKS